MGLLLDTVPNHMGMGRGDNPWWQDVLQNGRASAYADFFDIDWEPLKPELRNKVLIPILGNPYGEDLESGHIQVALDNGRPVVKYFDKVLPIDPQTIPLIFGSAKEFRQPAETGNGSGLAELNGLITALGKLPANSATDPAEVRRRQNEMPALLGALCTNHARVVRGSRASRSGAAPAEWNDGETRAASTCCTNCWRSRRIGWRSGASRARRSITGASSTSTTWSGFAWRIRACLRRRIV